jgi:hypothetical protein
MTAARERLPNRRASESFSFECNGLHYTATISRYADGRLAEIFLSNCKAGSHSDAAARDSAVVCSLALQGGVPLDVIRHALLRDGRGIASSPLGQALDLLAVAEKAAELKKSDRCYIEGTIKMDAWRGSDGTEHHGLSVAAFKCEPTHRIGRNKPDQKQKERDFGSAPAVAGSAAVDDEIPEWRG